VACCKPARATMKVDAIRKAVAKAKKASDTPHQGEKKPKAKKASAKKATAKPAPGCQLCGKAAKQAAALKAKKR
jgi:hypothetical protein